MCLFRLKTCCLSSEDYDSADNGVKVVNLGFAIFDGDDLSPELEDSFDEVISILGLVDRAQVELQVVPNHLDRIEIWRLSWGFEMVDLIALHEPDCGSAFVFGIIVHVQTMTKRIPFVDEGQEADLHYLLESLRVHHSRKGQDWRFASSR